MIDIGTHGGIIHEVDMQYEVMRSIMADSFIKDHQFIDFQFTDGVRGSVKKVVLNFSMKAEKRRKYNARQSK